MYFPLNDLLHSPFVCEAMEQFYFQSAPFLIAQFASNIINSAVITHTMVITVHSHSPAKMASLFGTNVLVPTLCNAISFLGIVMWEAST